MEVDGNRCAIVCGRDAILELSESREEKVKKFLMVSPVSPQCFPQPDVAEQFPPAVGCFGDAVGIQQQAVPLLECKRGHLQLRFLEETYRLAGGCQFGYAAGPMHEG